MTESRMPEVQKPSLDTLEGSLDTAKHTAEAAGLYVPPVVPVQEASSSENVWEVEQMNWSDGKPAITVSKSTEPDRSVRTRVTARSEIPLGEGETKYTWAQYIHGIRADGLRSPENHGDVKIYDEESDGTHSHGEEVMDASRAREVVIEVAKQYVERGGQQYEIPAGSAGAG
jgi:hypothetical protein